MTNIGLILGDAGLTYDDIVKTTIFLLDIADFAAVNEVYAKYFTGAPPARSTFQVAALPVGFKVEIEVIGTLGTPMDQKQIFTASRYAGPRIAERLPGMAHDDRHRTRSGESDDRDHDLPYQAGVRCRLRARDCICRGDLSSVADDSRTQAWRIRPADRQRCATTRQRSVPSCPSRWGRSPPRVKAKSRR